MTFLIETILDALGGIGDWFTRAEHTHEQTLLSSNE